MKPDDELLALWVDDELEREAFPEVDAWARANGDWVRLREQARASKELLGRVMPASEEVPSAEFFNARIRREIEVSGEVSRAPAATKGTPRWAWFMPAAAAAGMVFGFWIGKGGPEVTNGIEPPAATLAPVLYTPTKGVEAEYVDGNQATVIVLAGVDAIPDSWEIPETVMIEKERPHTASKDSE